MKVFISWSGDLSNKIAITLKEWIPNVLQSVEPYVSSEDIDKGSRWSTDIAKELVDSTYGILCVTKDNLKAPWLIFEAGALSKKLDISRVCPLLYNLKVSEIEGPLLQFQATTWTKEDILKLMVSLNNSCNEQMLATERLKKTFEVWWLALEDSIKEIDIGINHHEINDESNNKSIDMILEEILYLIQTQQKLLRRPDELLPPMYLAQIFEENMKKLNGSVYSEPNIFSIKGEVIEELFYKYKKTEAYFEDVINNFKKNNNSDSEFLVVMDTVFQRFLSLGNTIAYISHSSKYPDLRKYSSRQITLE